MPGVALPVEGAAAARPDPKPPFASTPLDDTPISALTLMRAGAWRAVLEKSGYAAEHPERAREILNAIEFGVPVDFVGDRSAPVRGKNSRMAADVVAKVTAIINADVRALKKAGPFKEMPMQNFFVSPIGSVPKASGEPRVIHNLSHPYDGASVNAGIPHADERCASFADAAHAVLRTGKGCFLIKLDVEAAYKQIPVRREDWHLLGFWWLDAWFYERVLPFGLRSSCRLWELFALALHYFFEKYLKVPIVIHYVDDFLFVFQSAEHARALLPIALQLCADLGVPMAQSKTEGPTTCLTFLGLELDTVALTAKLPRKKLDELLRLTKEWVEEVDKKRTLHELQSLQGKLNFACQVVRPGRFFMRALIERSAVMTRDIVKRLHAKRPGRVQAMTWPQMVKAAARSRRGWLVTTALREDLGWWVEHLTGWNGVGLLHEQEWINDAASGTVLELQTDACLRGYGAVWREHWFEGAWRPDQLEVARRGCKAGGFSIAFLELHAIVQAAATWGHMWARRRVMFLTDSLTSVHDIFTKGSRSADKRMTHLLRHLARLAIRHQFEFRAQHIPGVTNIHADVLSRAGDCADFRAQRPQAAALPSVVEPIPLPPPEEEAATPPVARSAQRRARTSADPSPPRPASPTTPPSDASDSSWDQPEPDCGLTW